MLSYQYKDSHVKDKTVSLTVLSLTCESPYLRKTVFILRWGPGPRFNIRMTSYQYRKSHCGDKTILRPSYLHNGISYTGKTTSLYWIRALVSGLHVLSSPSKFHQVGVLRSHSNLSWKLILDRSMTTGKIYSFYGLTLDLWNSLEKA